MITDLENNENLTKDYLKVIEIFLEEIVEFFFYVRKNDKSILIAEKKSNYISTIYIITINQKEYKLNDLKKIPKKIDKKKYNKTKIETNYFIILALFVNENLNNDIFEKLFENLQFLHKNILNNVIEKIILVILNIKKINKGKLFL